MGAACSQGTANFESRMPCDLSEVRGAASQVRNFLATQGCAARDINDAALAVIEACNNAVQYAEGAGRSLPIFIRLWLEAAGFRIEITDHTSGFDWPHRPAPPGPEAEQGRGIFLIQSLMDETRYERGSGQNTLVLHKRRQPKQEHFG